MEQKYGLNTNVSNTFVAPTGPGWDAQVAANYIQAPPPLTAISNCPFGHSVDANFIEYVDGVVISYCTSCGDRVQIPRIPGGVCWTRAGSLIGAAMQADEEEDEISELLGTLKEVERQVEAEVKRLAKAQRMLTLARQILSKKALNDATAASVVG